MCSIGASSNQSLAAASTMSTALGGSAISTGNTGSGARRVAGGMARPGSVLGGAPSTAIATGGVRESGGYRPGSQRRTVLAEY